MTPEEIEKLQRIADEYVEDKYRTDYYERETALAALPKLLKEREALLEALRAIEWSGDSFQGFASVCPDCVGREDSGHVDDCGLAAAIRCAEAP